MERNSDFVNFQFTANIRSSWFEGVTRQLYAQLTLTIVIDTIAGELGRVNNGKDITPYFEFLSNWDAPEKLRFDPVFSQLSNILHRKQAPSFAILFFETAHTPPFLPTYKTPQHHSRSSHFPIIRDTTDPPNLMNPALRLYQTHLQGTLP